MDNVNHPDHYEKFCSLECIEAMEIAFGTEAVIDFCKCNAFKYLWRYQNKNGREDLQKAMWYCNKGLSKNCTINNNVNDEVFENMIKLISKKEKNI